MVRQVGYTEGNCISLIRFYCHHPQQHYYQNHHLLTDVLTTNTKYKNSNNNMREEPSYSNLLLTYVQDDVKNQVQLRPVQFVHEWGSVGIKQTKDMFFLLKEFAQ